jgi:alkylation response protein AidB-like acyl-CoA dehydrogenase
MALVLNEEHILLKESARGFLDEKAPISQFRKLRDEKNPDGYSKILWAEMVDMGWAGIVVPCDHGGLEYGYVGAGIIMEEMGRTLTASPMLSSAIIGASVLAKFGSSEQQQAMLPKLAEGSLITALAVDEGRHHNPKNTMLSAKPKGNGYVLNGEKSFVLDGNVADEIIIAARTSGELGEKQGLTLFHVPRAAVGLSVSRTIMVDQRNAANIKLSDVVVTGEQIIGNLDDGYGALEYGLNVGRACLAAEMLGGAKQSFEMTLEYLKERKQFGEIIGTFQGLQHRAADLFGELELAKSVVIKALSAIDENDPMMPAFVSLAKAKVSEVMQLATNEAVQMHGGIGMTDEFDIGFFMKRARAAEATYGDYNFHADRLARMRGY